MKHGFPFQYCCQGCRGIFPQWSRLWAVDMRWCSTEANPFMTSLFLNLFSCPSWVASYVNLKKKLNALRIAGMHMWRTRENSNHNCDAQISHMISASIYLFFSSTVSNTWGQRLLFLHWHQRFPFTAINVTTGFIDSIDVAAIVVDQEACKSCRAIISFMTLVWMQGYGKNCHPGHGFFVADVTMDDSWVHHYHGKQIRKTWSTDFINGRRTECSLWQLF